MATDKIKRLEKKLKALCDKSDRGISGRRKVDLLNELAWAYQSFDYTKTESYAKRALVLATKLHYAKGIALGHQYIGVSQQSRYEYDKAIASFISSSEIFRKIHENKEIAANYNWLALVYKDQGNYELALKYLDEAVKLSKNTGAKNIIINAYNNTGAVYENLGDYELALDYYLKAIKIGKGNRNKFLVAPVYNNIGLLHYRLGDNEEALRYHRICLEICKKEHSKIGIGFSYSNMGMASLALDKTKQALRFQLKSLKIWQEMCDSGRIAMCFQKLGRVYETQKDYKRALTYYSESLKIFREIGKKKGIAGCMSDIARMYLRLQNYDLATKYSGEALQLAKEIGTKAVIMAAYHDLYELHKVQHRFNQALDYHEKYANLKEEIFNAEKSRQISALKIRYDIEQKEKEAEIHRLKNIELHKEIKQRKNTEKELKKHRDHLEDMVGKRTVELEKENAERKRVEEALLSYQQQLRLLTKKVSLVEEEQRRKFAAFLHDDISQALALATFKLRSLQEMDPKKDAKTELREVKTIIDTVAERTRTLAFEISPPILYELGLEPAVEWLVHQFGIQYEIDSNFKDDGLPKPMTDDARVFLFQSVRELLSNISKHAQAKSITVSTIRNKDKIRIVVEDDGVGFDPKKLNQMIAKNEGFGLFNVKERLRHLRGQLEVKSEKGKGAAVTLIAPLQLTHRKVNSKRRSKHRRL